MKEPRPQFSHIVKEIRDRFPDFAFVHRLSRFSTQFVPYIDPNTLTRISTSRADTYTSSNLE